MSVINGILSYVTVAVLGVSSVLSLMHYLRRKNALYLVVACGSLVWFAGLTVFLALPVFGFDVRGLEVMMRAVELAAVMIWLYAFCSDDAPGRVRVGILFAFVFFVSSFLAIFNVSMNGPLKIEFLLGVFQVGVSLYALVYSAAHRTAGRHYYIQGFLFLLLAFSIRFVLVIPSVTVAGAGPMIFAQAALVFGAVSIVLFSDSTYSAQLAKEVNRQWMIARIYESLPGIIKEKIAAGDFDPVAQLDSIAAEIFEEEFGYAGIFAGVSDGRRHRLELSQVMPDEGAGPAQIELQGEIVGEILDTEGAVHVRDLERDHRVLNKTLVNKGVFSFVALTLDPMKVNPRVMMVSGKMNGAPLDENDAALIEVVIDRIPKIEFDHMNSSTGSIFPAANGEEHEKDSVTQLPNYSSFQKILTDTMAEADKNSRTFALLLFDSDHFSSVNEKLGYERGDQILKDIGEKLAAYAEPGCSGRVGADEFALLLPANGEDIRSRTGQIQSEMNESLREIVGDEKVPLGLSVAYSIYPYDFMEQTGVMGKMREILASGESSSGRIVRVKVG